MVNRQRRVPPRVVLLLSCTLAACGGAPPVQAGPRVLVVHGPSAPALERLAAEEIAKTARRIFQAEAAVGPKLTEGQQHVIAVGSPGTNPLLAAPGWQWPALSNQGHLLRSTVLNGRPVLVAGGGSPVATYWAAAELARHWGVRSTLTEDLDPVERPALRLEGIDRQFEPALPLRVWRTINDFPIGPESWGLAEHERVIRQLARLKFNRLLLSIYPWQPFVDFSFHGVRKQSALLWFGYKYPVDNDTAGRGVFGGASLFDNPELAGKQTYEERIAAGIGLVRGIMQQARTYGMSIGVLISPLEFPKEFAAALPGAKEVRQLESLTIGPGAAHAPNDPTLLELAKAQIRAYLETYPGIDALYLTLPEFPGWNDRYQEAWKSLDARCGLGRKVSLESLIQSAQQRGTIASGERGGAALKGNLVALEFFHALLQDDELLRRADGGRAELVLVDVDPALYPYLDLVQPRGAGNLHFIDYTARRSVRNRALLNQVPAKDIPSSLILTLADDNVGLLPQSSLEPLAALVRQLTERRWQGFSTRYWIPGDLDLAAWYLSRASFEPAVTPRQTLEEFVGPVAGPRVAGRVQLAFEKIEQATEIIERNDLGFAFPVPNVVLKHYQAEGPPPGWWAEVRELYLAAMNEFYRANQRAQEDGRRFTLYLARRLDFAFNYMLCVEAVRQAGQARRAHDAAAQRQHLEAAADAIYDALNALAAVAKSNSDRGVIAVLNEYGYRPIARELQALEAR